MLRIVQKTPAIEELVKAEPQKFSLTFPFFDINLVKLIKGFINFIHMRTYIYIYLTK